MASGKPEAHEPQDPVETMEIPTEPLSADPLTDEQRRRNLLQENEQQFEQLSDTQKIIQTMLQRHFVLCQKMTIFHHT